MGKFIERKGKYLVLGESSTEMLFLRALEVGYYYGKPACGDKKEKFSYFYTVCKTFIEPGLRSCSWYMVI